jgi:hypothetical protein
LRSFLTKSLSHKEKNVEKIALSLAQFFGLDKFRRFFGYLANGSCTTCSPQ